MGAITPATPGELCDAIAGAAADGIKLEIRGGGSKADAGARRTAATLLDMTGFAGVQDYSPAELVLTAGAGTPLAEIESLLETNGQMLAFEPFEYALAHGGTPGRSTLGGAIAAGVCGPRAITAGRPRDHLLGFEAVSGRGERFVAGGKVVKNVTGYDLPKLMAGSWGRLAAMTTVTLKVLPRPPATGTLTLEGLTASQAFEAMATAMGSSAGVGSASYLPARASDGGSLAAFRIEGFEASIGSRKAALARLLEDHGPASEMASNEALRLWSSITTAESLHDEEVLWRIIVPPANVPRLSLELEAAGARWFADWAGALIWASPSSRPSDLRAMASAAGGHATLVRAPAAVRAVTPMFHPDPPSLAGLSERVRRGFDPAGVFETSRFPEASHAD